MRKKGERELEVISEKGVRDHFVRLMMSSTRDHHREAEIVRGRKDCERVAEIVRERSRSRGARRDREFERR